MKSVSILYGYPRTLPGITNDTEYPSPGLRLACFSANETNGRYVKIMAEKLPSHPNNSGFLMAFSEIEVLSKGKPVSYGVTVSSSHKAESNIHSLSMLVNGVCSSGKIIPIRSWLSDLSKRHKMERKHALLESTLQDRYLKQSNNAKRLKWGIGIALILALIVYFWQRQTRIHQMYRLRETLAADLHDEIGGNFSGIALLSDELAQENDMPQKHLSQLTSIGKISRDSAKNARALVRFLESRSVSGKLQAEMRSTAELLLKKHHYEFEVKGYHYVSKLSPKDKWHILLFFKEALNNIVKHANASKVDIKFLFDKKKLTLDITDNGRGLPSDNSQKPSHLAMRAKKLNANFDITSERDSGTTIHLEKKL